MGRGVISMIFLDTWFCFTYTLINSCFEYYAAYDFWNVKKSGYSTLQTFSNMSKEEIDYGILECSKVDFRMA